MQNFHPQNYKEAIKVRGVAKTLWKRTDWSQLSRIVLGYPRLGNTDRARVRVRVRVRGPGLPRTFSGMPSMCSSC